ncbi:HAD family hydrolase [Hungatella effluvii]|uniref:HAD family hydrolase n=1 Tax=Hungatella effluvii TaxID=1096246 RepID=UPI0022E8015C|nr:HAD family hydrolase [Hungatella effluvii]
MPRYKALLTDLDGTLVHSQDCICEALIKSFQNVKVRVPSKDEIMGMFGLPVEVMLTTLTETDTEDRDTILRFIEEYKKQYPIYMEGAGMIEHAFETVNRISEMDCPVCLITSERRKNAEHILRRLGLDKPIKFMVTRDDVTRFKPDPEPILKGAAACGYRPEECVYIGESPFDIEAGVAAGAYTVAVPSGNWPRQSLEEQSPDCLIEDISQLLPIFRGIKMEEKK